jgi:hypothetical protein
MCGSVTYITKVKKHILIPWIVPKEKYKWGDTKQNKIQFLVVMANMISSHLILTKANKSATGYKIYKKIV